MLQHRGWFRSGLLGTYPLGTDHIGCDVLSRLLYGARVSLGVGCAATTLSVVVALLIGGVAGFVGGKLDLAVQRVVGDLSPGAAE